MRSPIADRYFRGVAEVCILLALLGAGCGGSSSVATSKGTPTLTPTPTSSVAPTATPTATPTPVNDAILFSPEATTLTPSSSSSQFTINLTAYDSNGNVIPPSSSNPINLAVYGAPSGVINPTTQSVTTSSATFTYSGAPFPNNITINAWIGDSGSAVSGQQALGQTLLMPPTPIACASSSQTYSVSLVAGLPSDLQFTGAVGYTTATPPTSQTFDIDTGSLGTIIPKDFLPSSSTPDTFVIGPGPIGTQCYTSSNNAYFGHYYLAPVDIQVSSPSGGTTFVQTTPILVLVAEKYCSVTDCTSQTIVPGSCTPPGSIYYLGVGFDRPGATPNNLFHSPAANAFLHVTDASNGTDIAPGYVLGKDSVTLGINGNSGYNVINLSPSTTVPGDWQTEQGCYSFPPAPSTQFCGELFLDAGIGEMFLNAPMEQWPAGDYTPIPSATPTAWQVPTDTTMNVFLGSSSSPAMSYSFNAVETPRPTPGPTPIGPAPDYAQWIDSTDSGGKISANIGRNPLNCYNYFYQGQCGEVGFHNTSSTGDCAGAQ